MPRSSRWYICVYTFNPIRNFRIIFIGQTLPISSLPNIIRVYIGRISVIDPFTLRAAGGPITRYTLCVYTVYSKGVDVYRFSQTHTHTGVQWRTTQNQIVTANIKCWYVYIKGRGGRPWFVDLGREMFSLNGPWRPTDPDKKGKNIKGIKEKKRMHLVSSRVPRPQQPVKWSFAFSRGDGFVSPTCGVHDIHTHRHTHCKVRDATTDSASAAAVLIAHLYIWRVPIRGRSYFIQCHLHVYIVTTVYRIYRCVYTENPDVHNILMIYVYYTHIVSFRGYKNTERQTSRFRRPIRVVLISVWHDIISDIYDIMWYTRKRVKDKQGLINERSGSDLVYCFSFVCVYFIRSIVYAYYNMCSTEG